MSGSSDAVVTDTITTGGASGSGSVAASKPAPLNAKPPDDLPCWVWDEETRPVWDEMDIVPGIAQTE
jgi:hypothetical protein